MSQIKVKYCEQHAQHEVRKRCIELELVFISITSIWTIISKLIIILYQLNTQYQYCCIITGQIVLFSLWFRFLGQSFSVQKHLYFTMFDNLKLCWPGDRCGTRYLFSVCSACPAEAVRPDSVCRPPWQVSIWESSRGTEAGAAAPQHALKLRHKGNAVV